MTPSHKFRVEELAEIDPVLVEIYEERAAIMEYEGGLDRFEAEGQAMASMVAYMRSRGMLS